VVVLDVLDPHKKKLPSLFSFQLSKGTRALTTHMLNTPFVFPDHFENDFIKHQKLAMPGIPCSPQSIYTSIL